MGKAVLVTGGAGFIGSAVVRMIIGRRDWHVVNIDKLTYAGNLESVAEASESERYSFEQLDIASDAMAQVFTKYRPEAVIHLAAESHVDRSIDGPADFIHTNIVGTYNLLECARSYWSTLNEAERSSFRFHHVSTDEVYGSLGDDGMFLETTPYRPNSPYSASKAASDHLVRAWYKTYGLPTLVSNCSNNYGPYQFPEKLIPLIISKALNKEPLPVYGTGSNVRDWLYVYDHAEALLRIVEKGVPGETYNVGGNNEIRNIDVVNKICAILDELVPRPGDGSYSEQITFVKDRPGHDYRYAIDSSKVQEELGWSPRESFDSGIVKTVQWYLDNQEWCQRALNHYRGERLGGGA